MPITQSPKYKYQEIAQELTVAIRKGYKPGDMLASEGKLAEEFSVMPATVRRALDVLSEKGLIQRYHRRGTIVLDPLSQGEFAIVIRPELLKSVASPYYRETAGLLSEKIRECNNVKWFPKLHLGGEVDRGENYPVTLDILEPDIVEKLRAVFSFHPLRELREPLRQKNIPLVLLASYGEADAFVIHDMDPFYRETVRHLRAVGCNTVGFLWHHKPGPLGNEDRMDRFFAKQAIEAGLSTQEKWMPAIVGDVTERKAYELFIEFWEQDNHPDAIVINDDIITCGVLRAMLHKQIQVPEQIRLVTFAHKGVSLPYHLPITRYEYDMDKIATIALEMMVKLLNGQELEQSTVFVHGSLVKGQTT